jgi:hypothetical protein
MADAIVYDEVQQTYVTGFSRYTVTTPDGQLWCVRDYGDELTAHKGADLLDPMIARVPVKVACEFNEKERLQAIWTMLGACWQASSSGAPSPTPLFPWMRDW